MPNFRSSCYFTTNFAISFSLADCLFITSSLSPVKFELQRASHLVIVERIIIDFQDFESIQYRFKRVINLLFFGFKEHCCQL